MKPWEIHPGLVHFPVAFLLAGVILDVYSTAKRKEGLGRIAAGLLVAGVATGWLSALAGILAWYTAPSTDDIQPLMYWHPAIAAVSMLCFTPLAVLRWRKRALVATPAGDGLAAFAAVLLLVAAYLGGHLVFRGATGVTGRSAGVEHTGQHSHEDSKSAPTAD